MKCERVVSLFLTLVMLMGIFSIPVNAESEGTIISKVSENLNSRVENNVLEGAMPCRGEANVLIVDLCMSGIQNELSTQDIYEMAFGDYYTYEGIKDQNITDYFNAVSYGKLKVTGKVVNYIIDSIPNSVELAEILNDILSKESLEDYDKNNDKYLDGIIFLFPDNYTGRSGGSAPFWSYTYEDYSSAEYVEITNKINKNNRTIIHEMIHLMGLPDIYANVSLNPAGTCADALMAGGQVGRISRDTGSIIADLPGIMKYFFGWIDDLVEVSSSGTYQINSYSVKSSAMFIYPRGDVNGNFVFFIEYITPENTNLAFENTAYIGKGGLRIWKVYLNIDEQGNIKGNDNLKGCGNSPYSYLEAINVNEEKFVLKAGGEFSADTIPSSNYSTEFESIKYYSDKTKYTYSGAKCKKNDLSSGITLSNLITTNGVASFNIEFDEELLNEPELKGIYKIGNDYRIDWEKVDDADGYYVNRKVVTDVYSEYERIAVIDNANVCTYTDSGTEEEKKYAYTIEAYNSQKTSGYNTGLYSSNAIIEERVNYKINSITIKDTSGNELSTIPNGTFLATVSFTNVSSSADTVIVLAQYTDAGAFKGLMYIQTEDVPTGSTIKLSIPVDNSNGDIAKLKAFCWESFGSLTPMGNSASFPAE